jgi:hypothetical protein
MSLHELERHEYELTDLLFNLPLSEVGLRTQASDTLRKVRALKAEFIRRGRNNSDTDIIRKSSSNTAAAPPPRSPLIDGGEVRKMVREAVDRTAAEHRLAKGVVTYDPHRRDSDAAPVAAIRRALAQPYRETSGLITLLTKRG